MLNYLNETAERLSLVLADENTDAAIEDVLKEIVIEMENESQISSYHPEVIKVVYPLMVEALGARGKGFHHSIRCIIENKHAIDQTLFDGMGAPYTTPEQLEKAEEKRKTEREVLDLSSQPECLDLAKSLSDALNRPLIPTRLHNVIVDELSSIGNGEALKETINSPEYIAKTICEELGK